MFSPNQTGGLFDHQLLQKKFAFFTYDLDTDYIRNFYLRIIKKVKIVLRLTETSLMMITCLSIFSFLQIDTLREIGG